MTTLSNRTFSAVVVAAISCASFAEARPLPDQTTSLQSPGSLWAEVVLSRASDAVWLTKATTRRAVGSPLQQAGVQPAAGYRATFKRAVEDFRQGRIEESAAGFDNLVSMAPGTMPRLWQRGIVLYYAGRLDDCRVQFESHKTVNPNDVENAVWHFLCVAKAEGPEAAQASLLPVGPDSRLPMLQIYRLFSGTATTEDVMYAAEGQPSAEFYAHLYLGLHAEVIGDDGVALTHMRAAARSEFAEVGGYMHMVARVHLRLRDDR